MKCPRVVLLLSGILVLFSTGCTHRQPHEAADDKAPAQKEWSEFVRFPRQMMAFEPNREDFTVGKVVFSLYCSQPEAVRINGVEPDPAWSEIRLTETGVAVDTRIRTPQSNAWMYIYLPQVATNRFEMAPLTIEVSPEHQGFVCMSVKAWFNEVPNQYDGMFYQNLDDRYALVSYCTSPGDYPHDVSTRFGMNQVTSVQDFKKALASPFAIKLNEREIPDEWRSR